MDIQEVKEWRNAGRFPAVSQTDEMVDWLIVEVERLRQYEHEYICKRCGIRQNTNKDEAIF